MKRKIRFPLLAKMLIMTLFVSLIPLGMMSFMAYNGINYLTNNIVNVGTITLDDLGKKYIKEKAETVARQLEIYLKAHPEVKPENILNFSELKDIAIQKVGETGFTCLYDVNGIIFLHPQREMTKGFNLRALSKKFPIWWRIIEKSFKEPTGGEYLWKDPDGKIRKKYMYSVPVGDTPFRLGATTYIREFSSPLERIQSIIKTQSISILTIVFIIFALFFIFALVFSFLFARWVAKPITELTDIADRIALGDFSGTITVKRKDEIGMLSESLSRMQESLKVAIERLRAKKRRKRI
ncbi:MAG: hypothetical protein DRG20_06185 [Deltaproteobacteria bacterium]|nr:MAG: hypothetical protein DRG20_06185 [Deltaproteobacteria bacterium]